jgi:crotonobetainyl-CoA:carnitine CoA-transferase CaiB-like acyl-CoA transferase
MSALSGLKVLEFSRVLAGPWCGMTLADLGAEVTKLEPLDGDDTRGYGPPFRDGLSAYFACCNRNKRSLALDLRHPQARPLLEALIADADVLVENFRSGAAAELGIDYAHASTLNPRLVYCAISGYGRDGPDAARAGYDFVVQAESGLMAITGPADGPASKVGVATADITTGLNATVAILAALRQRDATGRGQYVEVSLFDSQLQALANVASSVLFTGDEAVRHGNAHATIVPYQTFAARDGTFALAVASDRLWRRLCALLERPDWVDDPRCASNAARVQQRDWLVPQLAVVFAQHARGHWLAHFAAAGIPAAPVNGVREALAQPLVQARGLRVDADGVPMLASPLRLADSPVEHYRRPPQLGEHADAICRELGLDADALRAAGAIR